MSSQRSRSLIPGQYEKEAAVRQKIQTIFAERGYFGPASVLLCMSFPTATGVPLQYDQFFSIHRGLEREIVERYLAAMSVALAEHKNQGGLVLGKNFSLVGLRRVCFENKAPVQVHLVMWLPDIDADLQEIIAVEVSKNFGAFLQIVFPGL
ncbi:hypothetical protein KC902_00745 [Candidatus Kaiserbacteria bacterium]|nr:hypothetical protein [Candidatus Kaiserbacteria bacterium]USN88615.1 MAG: hypothetical protein H6780_03965 [Candidatus Nomurabacteria bacterium]